MAKRTSDLLAQLIEMLTDGPPPDREWASYYMQLSELSAEIDRRIPSKAESPSCPK